MTRDGDVLMSSGSEFLTEGLTTEKEQLPNFDLDHGKMKWLCVTKRSVKLQ